MVLQYTVFRDSAETGKGPVLNENVITVGAGNTQSPTVMDSAAADAREPRSVRISVTDKCWVTWGEDPTALDDGTEGRQMGSDLSTVEYFDIPAGHKIAVITRA